MLFTTTVIGRRHRVIAGRTEAAVNPLRVRPVPDEEDQVLRLLAFRAATRTWIIGPAGSAPGRPAFRADGEPSHGYTLREPLDRPMS